jgi:hypothetical protein
MRLQRRLSEYVVNCGVVIEGLITSISVFVNVDQEKLLDEVAVFVLRTETRCEQIRRQSRVA